MARQRRSFGTGVITGVLTVLAISGTVGLIVVYGGIYNVAASEGHTALARWALDTTYKNSVRAHAQEFDPPDLAPADLREGAHEFAEYCVHCHGAPGVKPHEWASGMLPNPPSLSRAATQWSTSEIFWIVKHGVKMTGMPPFGGHHDDGTIWKIAAFVDRLPELTPEEYQSLVGSEHGQHSH